MKTSLRLTIAALGLAIFTVSTATVQAQFDYIVTSGTITITGGCPSSPGTVTIPGTINGLAVTTIGDEAFNNCRRLTSVTITASVHPIAGSQGLSLQTKSPVSFDYRKHRFHEVHSRTLHIYADKDGIDGAHP